MGEGGGVFAIIKTKRIVESSETGVEIVGAILVATIL